MLTIDKPRLQCSRPSKVLIKWKSCTKKKTVKVCSYIISQYSVHCTAQSVLHFSSPGRPVQTDTNSTSLGSILATQQLREKTIHSHFTTTVYSQALICTAERTGASRTKMPNLRNSSKGDSKMGSPDCESGILPLSYLRLNNN